MDDRVKEIYTKMQELTNMVKRDQEMAHVYADDLLCELLKILGHEELVDIYESMDKWHA